MPSLAERGLPILADSWSFDKPENLETLLAARPEIVVASVPYRLESLAAILKSGVPALALAPRSLADVYADIRILGSLAGADGSGLVDRMQQAISEVWEHVCHIVRLDRPLVYCEEWGKPLIHSQGWVAELVEAAGGRFCGTPGAQTTAEAVAAAQPDVLLFAWCGVGDRVPLARIVAQRSWQTLGAVQRRRVYCIPDEFLNTPAPTLMEGLACIAAAVHPAIFPLHPRLIRLA